jgi:hypothetical protein
MQRVPDAVGDCFSPSPPLCSRARARGENDFPFSSATSFAFGIIYRKILRCSFDQVHVASNHRGPDAMRVSAGL